MNILLLNQHYPPDIAPTGRLLHGLACHLVDQGHRVDVYCSRRSYDRRHVYPARESQDGVHIHRCLTTPFPNRNTRTRMINYLSYCASLAPKMLFPRPRPDLILSLTTPPYIGFLGHLASALHHARHAHWIMDLYPDVMAAYRIISPTSRLYRVLQALTRAELRKSRVVVCLGPEMLEQVKEYETKGRTSQSLWVPPWAHDDSFTTPSPQAIQELRAQYGWEPDELILMYSGNMGRGHRFNEFLAAAKTTSRDTRLRWVFCGDGKRRPDIETFATANPSARIQMLPYAPPEMRVEHIASADVHLVSLQPDWERCMVPSKLPDIFAAGKPVIFVGAKSTQAARWVTDYECGWIISPGDHAGLSATIEEARDPALRSAKGAAAKRCAQKYFTRSENCARIARALMADLPE